MKTRRIAVVILLALVLAALLPLSAAADAWPMVYVYGQVRVGDATASDGVQGATVELYREGVLIKTSTTTSDAGDFGFGVSGIEGNYMVKVALPGGSGLTAREVWFGDAPAFTPDPAQLNFRLNPAMQGANFGPIIFWNDGPVTIDPDRPYPWVYVFGKVVDPAVLDPNGIPVGVAGVEVGLWRLHGRDQDYPDAQFVTPIFMGSKFSGDRGYYGFGISGQDNWYALDVNDGTLPGGYTGSAPDDYMFLLPPASPTVGPFVFLLF